MAKQCQCGAEPGYVITPGKSYTYAQAFCPKCGAKGIKQAGCDLQSAVRAAKIPWDKGEREAPDGRTV